MNATSIFSRDSNKLNVGYSSLDLSQLHHQLHHRHFITTVSPPPSYKIDFDYSVS